MEEILNEVKKSVSAWSRVAKKIGVSKKEQEMMSGAFRH